MRKLSFVLVLGLVVGCSSQEQKPEHIAGKASDAVTSATAGVDSGANAAVTAVSDQLPARRDLGMTELADAARVFADKVALYAFPEEATKKYPDGKVRIKLQRIVNTTDGHLDARLLGDKVEDSLTATSKVIVFSSADEADACPYEVAGKVSDARSTEGANLSKTYTIKLELVNTQDKSSLAESSKDYRFETATPAPDYSKAEAPPFGMDELKEALPALKERLTALAIPANARVSLSVKSEASFAFDTKAAEDAVKEAITATGKAAVVPADDASGPEKPYVVLVRVSNWRVDLDWVTVTIEMVDPADHSMLICISKDYSWLVQ